ncbi:UNVERIFIED_CONTAM: hypothetical protein Sradi_6766600 [Sesamum radiatum]|uniref:Uncharacterized protein n=1 Tax=Sesamum radiatum TaxID=300843 RepID=A0AAW2JU30_SESRA
MQHKEKSRQCLKLPTTSSSKRCRGTSSRPYLQAQFHLEALPRAGGRGRAPQLEALPRGRHFRRTRVPPSS